MTEVEYEYDAIDLFAGPGGWDIALTQMGLKVVGVEHDPAACLTREAAGLETESDDVRLYGPRDFIARGLIESPPCPTFSAAGKGSGRDELHHILAAIKTLAARQPVDYSVFSDERTGLTLEAMRWPLEAIDAGIPYEWIALEQVPAVLPVWEAIAEVLRAEGYSAATGCVQAEQYGVPQTRKRAILVASRVREVALPVPTHSKYYPRDKTRLDPGVLPWVSMAQALGWIEPAMVGFARRADSGEAVEINGETYRARDLRSSEDPAQAVTEKVRSWSARFGNQPNSAVRSAEEPAATIRYGGRMNACDWVRTRDDGSVWAEGSDGLGEWMVPNALPNATRRHVSEPAATITSGHDSGERHWAYDRPSTTVVGSFKPEIVASPGYRTTVSRQNAEGSVRVSPEEAAALQSVPAGYPFQGSKTKIYQQIGNMVPPLLAWHILKAVLGDA